MKNFVFLICLFRVGFSLSQVEVGSLYEEMPTDSVLPLSINNHTGLKPFIRVNNHYQPKYSYSISTKKDSFFTIISPLIDAGIDVEKTSSFRTGLGVSIVGGYQKWFYKIATIQGVGNATTPFFQPKSFVFRPTTGNNFLYTDIRGRVSFTPNKFFNFQTGMDQNFIGEGNRSLLLSDYGKPYPFASVRANFWKIDYTMLYQFFREETASKQWKSKYAVTHLLSFNATKWLNISLFESLVFMPKDTALNRGFDAEYLNPIIFLRPQEYSIGSSDNTFLGMQFSVKYKKHTLYGQANLDDFLLSAMKARNGYWANKYAIQLGVKGRFSSSNQHYFYRVESNLVRPYTYSHASANQNYGNQGFPLAHPYGSSFYELLGELKWQKEQWMIKVFANYYLHGGDKNDSISYGGNIYASYNTYPHEFNNKIGQGIKANGANFIVTTAYLIDKSTNLQVFMEHHLQGNTIYNIPLYKLFIGIRSCLWNDYRNY